LIEKSLSETDFGTSVPLILGSSWETDVAREKHGLLLEVGVPATEQVVVNRSYIGYRGALTLLEHIYSATVSGK
jgi:nitrogenase molybdenum-iron protein beta chain